MTNEDFVVVGSEDENESTGGKSSKAQKQHVDEPPAAGDGSDGYTWSRRLVFRAKLTMHTAFERADNADPAAVTALAVSKDHKTIYVGDEKGRVFSWSVSSKPGKGATNLSVDSLKFGGLHLMFTLCNN